MTHAFDTGSNKPIRTLIKQGVVTLLSPLKRSNGGYLLDVGAYGGITRTYTDETGIQDLVRFFTRSPTIAVTCGTRTHKSGTTSGRSSVSQMELLLYFTSQHSRGQERGRMESDPVALADDQADPGLDVIMDHTEELLLGQFPSLEVLNLKQIEFANEQELVTSEKITIWTQTYYLTVTKTIPKIGGEFRTAKQLLESIAWRVTTDPNEDMPDEPATSPTSIDFENDDLSP